MLISKIPVSSLFRYPDSYIMNPLEYTIRHEGYQTETERIRYILFQTQHACLARQLIHVSQPVSFPVTTFVCQREIEHCVSPQSVQTYD